MAESNSYFHGAGESIAQWTKRLDGVDSKTLDKNEQVKLDVARRGIPPQKESASRNKA
jgi:hypothetical protein